MLAEQIVIFFTFHCQILLLEVIKCYFILAQSHKQEQLHVSAGQERSRTSETRVYNEAASIVLVSTVFISHRNECCVW